MTGTKTGRQIAVIPAALVGVADQHGERGAGGDAVHEAGEDFDRVALLPHGADFGLPRAAAVEVALNQSAVQLDSCRNSVDDGAQPEAVRLAESGDAKNAAKGATAHPEFLSLR
ncbi:hypothetical protein SDC9_190196 [bioreactor metagenome]|uniref:Uncharacterized protein n=1 Tax=bioreactor metagenome TaxID=1076179 RepID=A0A645HWS6_9ZZZZ